MLYGLDFEYSTFVLFQDQSSIIRFFFWLSENKRRRGGNHNNLQYLKQMWQCVKTPHCCLWQFTPFKSVSTNKTQKKTSSLYIRDADGHKMPTKFTKPNIFCKPYQKVMLNSWNNLTEWGNNLLEKRWRLTIMESNE